MLKPLWGCSLGYPRTIWVSLDRSRRILQKSQWAQLNQWNPWGIISKRHNIFISDFYRIWLQFLNWRYLSITQGAPREGGPLFASHKLMRTLPNEVPELIRQCRLCQKWQFQHPLPKELWNFKEKSQHPSAFKK
jgi:hypothetical protein